MNDRNTKTKIEFQNSSVTIGRGDGADWEHSPDRWATKRAAFVGRAGDFDAISATIIAYAELGFSHSGIAKHVGVGEGTVQARMNDIDDVNPTALLSRTPDELVVDSPIGIDGTKFGGDD